MARLLLCQRRMLRSGLLLSLAGLTAGCTVLGESDGAGGGGKADGFGDDCELPEYGDGVCQADLACAAPDIDCFVLFADDAAGGAWFAAFEEALAAEEFRPPRAQVPESDPRFQRMRQLLDRGWDAYRSVTPVADLGEQRPALIVLEDPVVNAFVAPDLATGNAGFAVIVQTGALDLDLPDAPMLGLVMHELTHAVKLHIVADVKERIRRYYVADDGEPFGFEELDDPVAREHGEAWRALASEAGPFTQEDLGGLPLGGQLGQIFDSVIVSHKDDPACAGPIDALDALRGDLAAAVSPLDAGLHLAEPVRYRVDGVLAALRDDCLAGLDQGFIEVVAALSGATAEEVRASLTAEDLALVDGVHFIDAVAALAVDRRARMRTAEATFAGAAGYPWSTLRYYSYEEAADDATVPVLHAMELAPAGLGSFLIGIFDEATRATCAGMVDAGTTPPYGADLSDEHHATCWRVAHVTELAASGKLFGQEEGDGPAQYLRTAPPAAARPRPRLVPPRLSDLIVY